MGKRYVVSGAVAVLKVKDGKGDERYVYHGVPVDAGVYEQSSIDHCVQVGLISEVDDEPASVGTPDDGKKK